VNSPEGLQLDLLTVIVRLEQLRDEEAPNGLPFIAERIISCDLPRLRGHLTPETLAWAEANSQ